MIETLLAQPGRIVRLGAVIQCAECGVTDYTANFDDPAGVFRKRGWGGLFHGWLCRKCRKNERVPGSGRLVSEFNGKWERV
jgi:hypothetical protein